MEYLPRYEFQKCVGRYQGGARLRGFSCWDQYLAMGFAQRTYRERFRGVLKTKDLTGSHRAETVFIAGCIGNQACGVAIVNAACLPDPGDRSRHPDFRE